MDQYSHAQEFVNLMAKAMQILVQASEDDLYMLIKRKAELRLSPQPTAQTF